MGQPLAVNQQCGGKTKSGGKCKRPAGAGTGHVGTGRCKNHGGSTPTHELVGAVELARRESAAMGQPLEIEPADALLQCIRIAAGEVQYASGRIADLQPDEIVVSTRQVKARPLSLGKEGEDQATIVEEVTTSNVAELNLWIQVRHKAMDRLVAFSSVAIKAGLEERRVKIAEQQGELLAQVIRGVLADLGVADHPEAPNVVRRHLSLAASA